jgi:hypothetical protein
MGLQFMAHGQIYKLYAYNTKTAQYFKRFGKPHHDFYMCGPADQPTMMVVALFQKRLDIHGN